MPNSFVTLFCEDIRLEHSGQHTIVGVLPDNVAVPALPALFPKLGIYVRGQLEVTSGVPRDISVSIKAANGADIPLPTPLPTWDSATISQGHMDAQNKGLPTYGLILTAVIAPFPVSSAGTFIMSVTVDGVSYTAGILNIMLTAPTSSSQPSGLAPPSPVGSSSPP
jgi:hypothetical protein